MITSELKNGEVLTIRKATASDALAMIEYINIVAGESEMITISPGEFNLSEKEEQTIILKRNESSNQIYVVALINEEIVGLADIAASPRKRIKHIGTLGISTLKTHWGKGIGRLIMNHLMDWATKNSEIQKLHLTVRVDNQRALTIYESLGFEIEGKQKNGLLTAQGMKDVYNNICALSG